MLRARQIVKTVAVGVAATLLAAQAAYGMGCGGNKGAGPGVGSVKVLKSFTTVANSSLAGGPVSPTDFLQFLGMGGATNPLVLSKSVVIENSVMVPGGTWTISNILGGPGSKTVLPCVVPAPGTSAAPVVMNLNVNDVRLKVNMKKKGGAAGGCSGGANVPAPVASTAAVSKLLTLSNPAFIAEDINTVATGSGVINGTKVNSFLTIIKTQLNGTKSQIEVLKTSFAPSVADPAIAPCQLINLAGNPPTFATNPGPDAAVQQILGKVLELDQAVASSGTPSVTIESPLSRPSLDASGKPILVNGKPLLIPTPLALGQFLMYAELDVYNINQDPQHFAPGLRFILENGNLK